MADKYNTMVLGAGTSFPYGFPLGRPLMSKVIRSIQKPLHSDGTVEFGNLLEKLGFSRQKQAEFANELHGSKQPSIDSFLQERGTEFLELGKASIAASLIPYEKLYNLLSMDFELEPGALNQRWYEYLINLLGTTRDQFCDNRLSIITFNYDRSLEYFIFHTLKHRFDLNDTAAIDMMENLPILHFYGQLGIPDFLDTTNGRAYSEQATVESVEQCVRNMYLMYEERDPNEVVLGNKKIYEILKTTQTLTFLGFGFHEKNLDRLLLREHLTAAQRIIAVFYGLKAGERERSINLVSHYSPNNIQVIPYDDHTVLDFLQQTNWIR